MKTPCLLDQSAVFVWTCDRIPVIMILAFLPPCGLTFAPRGSVRKSFTKWSSLSICYSYKSKNGLGLRQGIQDFSSLLCQIQLCPRSGEIQIPAASTAMERPLCYLLILISVSQAFVRKDMSKTAFVFPKESANSYVSLDALSKKPLTAFTVCLRIYTDLSTTRSFSIFSYATKKDPNDILIFWSKDRGYIFGVGGPEILFKASEIPESPTHICASWESDTGLVEFWVDGKPKVRRSLQKGYTVATDASIILGQEQDSYGGSFDVNQSFVGDIGDVNMWDTVLSPEQINTVYVGGTLSPNVLNWQTLKYAVQGNVFIRSQLWP